MEQALDMNREWSAPMQNMWQPVYEHLRMRAVRQGCQVLLTGSGGDEWLTVTPYLAADLMRRGNLRGLWYHLASMQRSFRLKPWAPIYNIVRFGLFPLAGMAAATVAPELYNGRRRRKEIATTPDWVAPDPALRKAMDDRAHRVLSDPCPADGFYLREARTSLDHPLVSMEHEGWFESGHRAGVRMLHPWWDPDVLDLLYRTPPRLLNRGGRAKGLVRRTIAQRFPGLGFERHKKVRGTAFYKSTILREAPAAWKHLGGTPTLQKLGVVNASVKSAVDNLLAGVHPQLYRVWSVLHLEAWAQPRA